MILRRRLSDFPIRDTHGHLFLSVRSGRCSGSGAETAYRPTTTHDSSDGMDHGHLVSLSLVSFPALLAWAVRCGIMTGSSELLGERRDLVVEEVVVVTLSMGPKIAYAMCVLLPRRPTCRQWAVYKLLHWMPCPSRIHRRAPRVLYLHCKRWSLR